MVNNSAEVIDVQRPANGGEAIDNIATWYVVFVHPVTPMNHLVCGIREFHDLL